MEHKFTKEFCVGKDPIGTVEGQRPQGWLSFAASSIPEIDKQVAKVNEHASRLDKNVNSLQQALFDLFKENSSDLSLQNRYGRQNSRNVLMKE
jgi:hypothetical protein